MQFELYRGDDVPAIIVQVSDDWESFANWSAEQGGEVARLSLEGHTDVFRGQDAIRELAEQLQDASGDTAQALRDALADDIEGVVVTNDQPARYGATAPAPDGKVHRDAFDYREAGSQPQQCANCRYYQSQDNALGDCIMFKSLQQAEPQRYGLSASVGPEFWCSGWEAAEMKRYAACTQGQRADLTDCTPQESEGGSMEQMADAQAESLANTGVLQKLGKAGAWIKDKTKQVFAAMESRYGRKTAIAIFAAGHVVGLATPLVVLPGSTLVGMAPFAAMAEVYLQAKNLMRHEADDEADLGQEQLMELAKQLVEQLKREWEARPIFS